MWTRSQHTYRKLCVAIRSAFYHDRAQMFWARHRIKVEMYKYGGLSPLPPASSSSAPVTSTSSSSTTRSSVMAAKAAEAERTKVETLHHTGFQVAEFIKTYMNTSPDRIERFNEAVRTLPLRDAKAYRDEYFEREREHRVWCKQRIRALLAQRPAAPYPF
eukprot:PhM_4_TR1888/c0_g1_i1/m.94055